MSHVIHRRLTLAALALSVFAPLSASGQVINEEFKVLADDGNSFENFGISIAIGSGVVAVGANGYEVATGSAYLFDASTGAQLFKLTTSDGMYGDFLGQSIAIADGIVAIGAPGTENDVSVPSGSVYLFDTSTGAQLLKFYPSISSVHSTDFGSSVDIANGVIAVGAYGGADNGLDSGAAYLFDASTGVQLHKFLPADGAAGDWAGLSISMDNGIVAVGAPRDDDNGLDSGSAYLFDASTGAQLHKLLPSDGAADDKFGFSIAIHNGVVAIGAVGDDDNGSISGSVYLFDASTGAQLAKLFPSNAAAGDNFGGKIAMDNGVVIVGAIGVDGNGLDFGSAYLFDASTGAQIAQLVPTDAAVDDNFGSSVAIANGVVAVGAYGDSDNGMLSGSAYVIRIDSPCPADLNNDGFLDSGDISMFVSLFLAGDLAADLNNDGFLDSGDIAEFVGLFLAGC